MSAHPPTPSGERAPPDSGDSRLARIFGRSRSSKSWLTGSSPSTASPSDEAAIGAAITRYPDAGATEVLLSVLLGTTFDEALRAAGALA
jgi:hypothetical protein